MLMLGVFGGSLYTNTFYWTLNFLCFSCLYHAENSELDILPRFFFHDSTLTDGWMDDMIFRTTSDEIFALHDFF